MKKFKFLLMAAIFMAVSLSAKADHDRVIIFKQLPAPAQTFHKQHFDKKVPLVVTADWDDYTIIYESGEKVEFNQQGEWKEIECRTSQVPTELIPQQIKSHLKSTFPGTIVIQIDRSRLGYEVKLNNGLEIEYDRSFRVVDIDD